MTLTLAHYLILGAILFAIGIFGFFLNRRNLIILLMSIELMLLSANMNFVAFSSWFGDTAGQVFVFFILTVAAAERSEEHTSELQSRPHLVCRLLLEKKKHKH